MWQRRKVELAHEGSHRSLPTKIELEEGRSANPLAKRPTCHEEELELTIHASWTVGVSCSEK